MSLKHLQYASYPFFYHSKTSLNIHRIYLFSTKTSKVILNHPESVEKESSTDAPKQIIVKNGDQLNIKVIPNREEEDILKQALFEKEKDACVRSRLSKECKHLFQSSPKNLSYLDASSNAVKDQNEKKCSNWEDYTFDHVLLKDTKHYSTEGISASPPPAFDNIKGTPTRADGFSSGGSNPPSGATPSVSSRITRGEPGEVIATFIPVEWWKFFLPKTGVTGFGTFIITYGTYILSKEYLVMEHNFYGGLSQLILLALTVKYGGPALAKYLDKEVDEYEAAWNKGREDTKKVWDDEMAHEHFLQFQAEGQLLLLQAKRENVQLQLEEEYRMRLMYAYGEVKRVLDYQVAVAEAYIRIQQKNLVQYVQKEVLKSITPDMQDKLINYSIEHIIDEMENQKKGQPSDGSPKGQGGDDPPKGQGGQDPPKGQGGQDPPKGQGSQDPPKGQGGQDPGLAPKPSGNEPDGGSCKK